MIKIFPRTNGAAGSEGAGASGGAGLATGNVTRMFVPRPSSLEASMVPPAAETMPWQMDNPSPVPMLRDLVVKNGSKIWGNASWGMPGPVS